MDWDTFWRWEIFYRRLDPVDYMRWKSDSSRALRGLPQGRDRGGQPPLLLDATCGLGYHAMAQRELGFRVEACDANRRVLNHAAELIRQRGLDIPTFQTTWEELGERCPERYDLIFNDEVHQVFPDESMLAVLRGFHGALRPGGSLVFFYADASKPDNGPGHARWDWEHSEGLRQAWSAEGDGLEVSLTIAPERLSETMILEHHRYRIRPSETGVERVETMSMPRNYLWDWNHIVPALEAAGFTTVESHQFVNVHGNTFSMNLATR